jgi:hypothetical protein
MGVLGITQMGIAFYVVSLCLEQSHAISVVAPTVQIDRLPDRPLSVSELGWRSSRYDMAQSSKSRAMAKQSHMQQAVEALLAQTGSAHDVYEKNQLNGVYDQNWPDWYATYLLQNDLNDLLGTSLRAEQLSGMLRQYDRDFKQDHPGVNWAQFYAARLLAQMRETD